jgi:protein ImuB
LPELRRNSSLLLRRPLWILSEPRPLATEKGLPLYQGALTLLDGPERLETGWWDGAGIARDYFVGVNPAGMHLWVFRTRNRESGWYLHGMFG